MADREAIGRLLEVDGRLPFLFVGSGLSLRYLGLPNWEGLLREFAKRSGQNFEYLLATHQKGKLEEIASRIGEEFTKQWFQGDSEEIESLRRQYPGKINAPGLALKYGVSEYLRKKTEQSYGRIDLPEYEYLEELDLLRKVRIEGIVTTNYDDFLERIFPDLVPYVGQQELLFSDAHFVGEIYKIHGSIADPPSLVLDSDDYRDFSKKNVYLVSKLLTIFAERPVIFLGYSINDGYVREILSSLVAVAEGGYLERLSDRLIFVQWDPEVGDSVVVTKHHFPAGGTSLPMTKIQTKSFAWLFKMLSELERGIPAAEIRQIQAQVYAAVRERFDEGGVPEFRVVELSSEADPQVRTIFGFTLGSFDSGQVGRIEQAVSSPISKVGYRAIRLDDLVEDVIGDSGVQLDPTLVLMEAIPNLPGQANAPIVKYLVEAGWVDEQGNLDEEFDGGNVGEIFHRIIEPPEMAISAFRRELAKGNAATLQSIMNDSSVGLPYRLSFPLLLDISSFSNEDLLDFIKWARGQPQTPKYVSYLRKLVAYYDRLEYLPGYRDQRASEVERILSSSSPN